MLKNLDVSLLLLPLLYAPHFYTILMDSVLCVPAGQSQTVGTFQEGDGHGSRATNGPAEASERAQDGARKEGGTTNNTTIE